MQSVCETHSRQIDLRRVLRRERGRPVHIAQSRSGRASTGAFAAMSRAHTQRYTLASRSAEEAAMQIRSRGNYEIADRDLIAEGVDVRVQVLTLAAGQAVPWHYHSEITDTMVCLEGPMVVETRAPRNNYVLR